MKVVIAKPIVKDIIILHYVLEIYDKYKYNKKIITNIESLMTYWYIINTNHRCEIKWKESMKNLRYMIIDELDKYDIKIFNDICRFMIPYIIRFQ